MEMMDMKETAMADEEIEFATADGTARIRLEPVPGNPALTRLKFTVGDGEMLTMAELCPAALGGLADACERAADQARPHLQALVDAIPVRPAAHDWLP